MEGSKPEATPVADDRGVARHDTGYGDRRVDRHLDAHRTGQRLVSFRTNVAELAPGVAVPIAHAGDELDEPVLVVGKGMSGSVGGAWNQTARAVFAGDPLRPALRTRKPRIYAVQTATVVGPRGQEIHCDEWGRVRAQFPWDRDARGDDESGPWMRVSQGWAGAGFGMIQIPRVGQEVLVAFLDGDPDEPIIVGRVFNALERVPYKLPENKTVSGWRTQSSPGGAGYNEVKFEDRAGKEHVYHQAQRDRHELVKRDEAERIERDHRHAVGRDQHLVVLRTKREHVVQDDHLHVEGDRYQKIDGSTSLHVGADREEKVGGKHAFEAGEEIHLQAGKHIVLDAGRAPDHLGPGRLHRHPQRRHRHRRHRREHQQRRLCGIGQRRVAEGSGRRRRGEAPGHARGRRRPPEPGPERHRQPLRLRSKAMPAAARITDAHTCPAHGGGPVVVGCGTVNIGHQKAARVGDTVTCAGAVDVIAAGASDVFIGYRRAARFGDATEHGGVITSGCPSVNIGTSAQARALGAAAVSNAPFCEECEKRRKEQEKEAQKKGGGWMGHAILSVVFGPEAPRRLAIAQGASLTVGSGKGAGLSLPRDEALKEGPLRDRAWDGERAGLSARATAGATLLDGQPRATAFAKHGSWIRDGESVFLIHHEAHTPAPDRAPRTPASSASAKGRARRPPRPSPGSSRSWTRRGGGGSWSSCDCRAPRATRSTRASRARRSPTSPPTWCASSLDRACSARSSRRAGATRGASTSPRRRR